MRRLPILPTLIVALAVAAMIALGIWQLRRAEWKERLLAEYMAAAGMPALDLDPLLDGQSPPPPLAFRRVLVTCHARDAEAEPRTGRNLRDETGQVFLVPCRPGADGLAGRLLVNAGWAPRHDAVRRLTLDGLLAGRIGTAEEGESIVVTAATATPPLQPGMPLSIEAIPNNHRGYAFTWFAFAAIAIAIYVLALRGRRRRELPPEP